MVDQAMVEGEESQEIGNSVPDKNAKWWAIHLSKYLAIWFAVWVIYRLISELVGHPSFDWSTFVPATVVMIFFWTYELRGQ